MDSLTIIGMVCVMLYLNLDFALIAVGATPFLLLFGGAILALGAVGFAGGIANHRGTAGKWLLAVLLGGTIFIVLDLDRERRGFFQISQEPIIHLRQLLDRGSHSAP